MDKQQVAEQICTTINNMMLEMDIFTFSLPVSVDFERKRFYALGMLDVYRMAFPGGDDYFVRDKFWEMEKKLRTWKTARG
jgi:hypothetical protein